MQSVRARVAACRRALAPRLVVAIIALAAIALGVGLLSARSSPLHVVDLPGYALFALFVLAVPAGAIVLAYHSHVREGRQRSEVESLLAIMRDVHAAAGTEAAAGRAARARAPARRRGRRRARAARRRRARAARPGRQPERARRSFTGDTTRGRARLLAELAHTTVIDLGQDGSERRMGLTASACRRRSWSRCAATTRVVGLLAVERIEPFGPRERRLLETVGAHAGKRARERSDGARARGGHRAQGAARARGAPRSADRSRQPLALLAARRGRARPRATRARR